MYLGGLALFVGFCWWLSRSGVAREKVAQFKREGRGRDEIVLDGEEWDDVGGLAGGVRRGMQDDDT